MEKFTIRDILKYLNKLSKEDLELDAENLVVGSNSSYMYITTPQYREMQKMCEGLPITGYIHYSGKTSL